MSNKQSSIEWLEEEFVKLERTIGVYGVFYELLGKAKEMHKQEIMEAHYAPKYGCFSEEYYNKTFGK